jgi:heptosyltransferase I
MKVRGNPWLKRFDRWVGIPITLILGAFKGNRASAEVSNPRKILLVKLNAVGDTLLFLTVAQELHRKFPQAEITYVGSIINQEVLARNPYLDRKIILDPQRAVTSPAYLWKFVRRLRKDYYDIAIDGSQWERIAAIIIGLVRSNLKIGFRTPEQWKHFVYHIAVPHRRDQHEMYCFHDLLEPLGIKVSKDIKPVISVTKDDRQRLELLIHDRILVESPILVIHPGCGEHGDFRQWSLTKFQELGHRWLKANDNGYVVLSGTGSEVAMCKELEKALVPLALSLAGELDLGATAALLERASILVCGNTGIMHLASAFETPTVAIHGPTDPRKWGPVNPNAMVVQSNLECAPCLYLGYEYGCDCAACMDAISVDDVWQILIEIGPVKSGAKQSV